MTASAARALGADWTNAFGTNPHGRQAIIAHLNERFADPRFAAVAAAE